MTNQELTHLLKRVKDAPELGGEFDADRSWQKFASTYGFPKEVQMNRYTLTDYLEYALHLFGMHIVRPVSVGLSVFSVIFFGWTATVSASFDSVPGDILYPVKIATERMQLTFASSSSRRAKLHAEFAGRRLQEVVEIKNSDRADQETLVRVAVDSFKQELAFAGEQLTQVQSESPQEAVEIAVVLDAKSNEYESVLAESQPGLTQGGQEAVAEALVVVEETNDQAIESLVVSHETDQQPQTAEHLQESFQQTYLDVKLRIALNLGRLSVIDSAITNAGLDASLYEEELMDAEEALQGHEETLTQAMDVLAAGGYRRAFELVSEVEAEVTTSEEIITDLEIRISTAIAEAQAQQVPEPPVISADGTEEIVP